MPGEIASGCLAVAEKQLLMRTVDCIINADTQDHHTAVSLKASE
jgi:hypothetical protein